ncbi:MAG: hypothetical protein JWQ64_3566, partial [Subtercola sp.]|nr:hypothetical protein [Subtercola sp.]
AAPGAMRRAGRVAPGRGSLRRSALRHVPRPSLRAPSPPRIPVPTPRLPRAEALGFAKKYGNGAVSVLLRKVDEGHVRGAEFGLSEPACGSGSDEGAMRERERERSGSGSGSGSASRHGYRNASAYCSSAARSVLLSSMAMVIGPTPPGTGVMRPATSATAPKSTSPLSPSGPR